MPEPDFLSFLTFFSLTSGVVSVVVEVASPLVGKAVSVSSSAEVEAFLSFFSFFSAFLSFFSDAVPDSLAFYICVIMCII